MKYMFPNSWSSWYVIISAIFLVWFLLILTTWSFHLVLQEMYDWRGKQNYLKAYAAAEAWLETALLKVKQEGYGYFEKKDFSSDILWDDIKRAEVSYGLLWKTQRYEGSLESFWVDIIPLFWIENTWVVRNLLATLKLEANNNIAWNIMWRDIGVWWNGGFESSSKQIDKKSLEDSGHFSLENDSLDAFLWLNEEKYILILNTAEWPLDYSISSQWDNFFTLPRHYIISSGRVGGYVQNIRTELDNTEFLWLLRYSIYAWE